jgi:hypothetical protein
MKKTLILFLLLFAITNLAFAQNAELHINNSSGRSMTVKIMNSYTNRLHKTLELSPYEQSTAYFGSTGQYYCKTEARKYGREPIYEKGNAFEVYVGSDGYSVLTITFSVSESSSANVLSGNRISKGEFDKN